MNYIIPDYPYNFKITYILQLEDDCWYVGRTKNGKVNDRITQHMTQCGGSGWTYTHKPVKVHRVLKGDREREVTLKLIERHGKDKVRGSNFVKVYKPSWSHKHDPAAIHGCITR